MRNILAAAMSKLEGGGGDEDRNDGDMLIVVLYGGVSSKNHASKYVLV